jgi:cysteine sulfinate desulfinase/cysteine desulfurase-like protein
VIYVDEIDFVNIIFRSKKEEKMSATTIALAQQKALEYAIRLAAERRLAAEQEENRRQLAELLERVRHMEVLVHRLLNELQGDGR